MAVPDISGDVPGGATELPICPVCGQPVSYPARLPGCEDYHSRPGPIPDKPTPDDPIHDDPHPFGTFVSTLNIYVDNVLEATITYTFYGGQDDY